MEPKTK